MRRMTFLPGGASPDFVLSLCEIGRLGGADEVAAAEPGQPSGDKHGGDAGAAPGVPW
jgi:hypothetical protein